MARFVLHHYPQSPFAEKARLMLGFKGLAYDSVTIPRVMPKPDLVALTGGYRKTPVLQAGADIFCDTALIARRIEREQPAPPLFPPGLEAAAATLAHFADHDLFQHSVALNFQPEALAARFAGVPEEHVRAFAADRGALFSGGTMRRMDVGVAGVQWDTLLRRIDAQLSARSWLLGDSPSIADIAHYHPIWFLASSPPLAPLLAPFAAVRTWMDRVAAIGHGTPSPMSSGDALELARASEPEPTRAMDDQGRSVTVAATDYGVEPVAGTLVWQDHEETVIARDDERAGRVHVHFPRIGFRVQAA
jgi:glutathione S-transferase